MLLKRLFNIGMQLMRKQSYPITIRCYHKNSQRVREIRGPKVIRGNKVHTNKCTRINDISKIDKVVLF